MKIKHLLQVLTVFCVTAAQAQTADEILNKYFENTGGRAKYEGVQGIKMNAKTNQGGMEIPIAMILACRLLPFRANRLANIIAGGMMTLVNGFLTFVPPLAGWGRPPAFTEYVFFATLETVATSVIIWQAWNWSRVGEQQGVRSRPSAV